jgi:hypothetical protein
MNTWSDPSPCEERHAGFEIAGGEDSGYLGESVPALLGKPQSSLLVSTLFD